jgi:putative membrane protein
VSKLRWSLIGLFVVVAVLLDVFTDPAVSVLMALIFTFLVFIIAILHSYERYGLKNTVIFFVITWAVSLPFEASNVAGFIPLGTSGHYALPSLISFFGVPFLVIFGYFGTGYFAWMLSHVLTGQWNTKLKGIRIVVIPFIAMFLMVMWDLGQDPIYSTMLSQWVWDSPGPYFGVPITNYLGWCIIVFIFYTLFALYLSKYDLIKPSNIKTLTSKPYWIEAAVVYGLIGLSTVVIPISVNNDITQSMALITIFTMIFVAIISFIAIMNNRELS